MSKKLPTSLLLMLFAISGFAQTIVSTSPENRKVILEEFTGIHCTYCPQGHAIAQAIQDANPGNVFLVNIHQGSYAVPSGGEPDFRTPWGNAIAGQSNLAGYPAGTVNRQVFPGQGQNSGSTAMSRNQWGSASNAILGDGSYVNVGVEAVIDINTNELTVHVEGYYTGNSPESSNLLNVALLQNNTLGPQTGGGMGNNYVHQHRLVDLLTGQWGITIPTTTASTFVDETFTYTLPTDYNGVGVQLADMEVVAFISETQQEIPSGSGAYPSYDGLVHANDVNLKSIEPIGEQCEDAEVVATIVIENLGMNTITSLDISYDINGGTTEIYNWTGNLTSLHQDTIELPGITYSALATNTINVTIPNDDENANNSLNTDFDRAVSAAGNLVLTLEVDNQGSQVRWNIRDSNLLLLYTGGPYPNNTTVEEEINLNATDCYLFTYTDIGANGGGSVNLTDINAVEVFNETGNYGAGFVVNFQAEGTLGINDATLEDVVIYPNPAKNVLNIVNAENASIEVFNILGQAIYNKSNIDLNEQVNVSNLTSGAYFVKITDGTSVKTDKFIINR